MNNFFRKKNEFPEINMEEDLKKRNRNFTVGFLILAFVLMNVVLYVMTRV